MANPEHDADLVTHRAENPVPVISGYLQIQEDSEILIYIESGIDLN